MRQIATLMLYRFSDEEIISLLKKVSKRHLFDNLPEWVVNDMGKITHPEYFFQFYFEDLVPQDKYYYFFSIHHADIYLETEIAESGIEEKYGIMSTDFCGKEINWNDFFDRHENLAQTYLEYRSGSFSQELRLVYHMNYINAYDYYSGGYECEIESKLIGWLNEDLNMIKI